MIMQAVVLEAQWGRLLVMDLNTRQRVIVNTPEARWINPGDFVRIWYNGVMTRSNPPQINAQSIAVLPPNSFPPVVAPPPVVFPPVVIQPVFPPVRPRPPVGPRPPRPPRPPHSGNRPRPR